MDPEEAGLPAGTPLQGPEHHLYVYKGIYRARLVQTEAGEGGRVREGESAMFTIGSSQRTFDLNLCRSGLKGM